MDKLSAIRTQIDALDRQLAELFNRRMDLSVEVAVAKSSGNLPLTHPERERQVVQAALAVCPPDHRPETAAFMQSLIALSKRRQTRWANASGSVRLPPPAPPKTDSVTVAYQGVEGAWGEQAAVTLYPNAAIVSRTFFDDVFAAVKDGEADYGVLPIENSQTGAIGEVYDLLRAHNCYIVGETRLNIAQCLLAREGVSLEEITEVFSHQEGLNQCRRFLKRWDFDQKAVRNTAVAAQMVANAPDKPYAAIGSRRAAQCHGLTVLAPDITDTKTNRTRFIAIAARPEYDAACDGVSVTFSTEHRSGALCAVLQAFSLGGINLTRLQSRPVSQNSYQFFADLSGNALSDEHNDVLGQAAAQCESFEILGCYRSAT